MAWEIIIFALKKVRILLPYYPLQKEHVLIKREFLRPILAILGVGVTNQSFFCFVCFKIGNDNGNFILDHDIKLYWKTSDVDCKATIVTPCLCLNMKIELLYQPRKSQNIKKQRRLRSSNRKLRRIENTKCKNSG